MKIDLHFHDDHAHLEDILEIVKTEINKVIEPLEPLKSIPVYLLFGNDDPFQELLIKTMERDGVDDQVEGIMKEVTPGVVNTRYFITRYGFIIKLAVVINQDNLKDAPVDGITNVIITALNDYYDPPKVDRKQAINIITTIVENCIENFGDRTLTAMHWGEDDSVRFSFLPFSTLKTMPSQELHQYFFQGMVNGGGVVFSDDQELIDEFKLVLNKKMAPMKSPYLLFENRKIFCQFRDAGENIDPEKTIGLYIKKDQERGKKFIFLTIENDDETVEMANTIADNLVSLCFNWIDAKM